MATVQCPTEIPVSHDHELLEPKRHVPYVRCDGLGSHIYFKTDAAREWLAAHLVNGTIENPSENSSSPQNEKEDDFFAGEVKPNPNLVEMGKCYNCKKVMLVTTTRCPRCGADIDWEL